MNHYKQERSRTLNGQYLINDKFGLDGKSDEKENNTNLTKYEDAKDEKDFPLIEHLSDKVNNDKLISYIKRVVDGKPEAKNALKKINSKRQRKRLHNRTNDEIHNPIPKPRFREPNFYYQHQYTNLINHTPIRSSSSKKRNQLTILNDNEQYVNRLSQIATRELARQSAMRRFHRSTSTERDLKYEHENTYDRGTKSKPKPPDGSPMKLKRSLSHMLDKRNGALTAREVLGIHGNNHTIFNNGGDVLISQDDGNNNHYNNSNDHYNYNYRSGYDHNYDYNQTDVNLQQHQTQEYNMYNEDPGYQQYHDYNYEPQTNNTESEWAEYWDEEVEATYYYNARTGEASWTEPEGWRNQQDMNSYYYSNQDQYQYQY